MRFFGAAIVLFTGAMGAQAPRPPDQPRSEPALAKSEPVPPVNEPPQPVLRNTGKPMLLPFACTEDDMQWAGMSCSEEEPCPVYLEISDLDTVGNRIVVLGNIHSEATTLYSVLLSSDDAGETWHEPYERMRGIALDHLQFIDFQNGWISGATRVPVSRDPFLLITSDGGRSWRLRAVNGEGGEGTILQFWFQTPKTGAMVIDRMESTDSSRYELYETPNGGETWMIRRTSEQPISVRPPASEHAESGWRIRADARSKAFAIEKKEAERWNTEASFLVHIGNCKPAANPTPAPPESPENEHQARALAPSRKPPSLKRPAPQ